MLNYEKLNKNTILAKTLNIIKHPYHKKTGKFSPNLQKKNVTTHNVIKKNLKH